MLKLISAASAALFLCLPAAALAQPAISETVIPTTIQRSYDDYTAIKGLNSWGVFADGRAVTIGSNRGGVFVRETSSIATLVTADGAECVAIPDPGDATGASGGFVRQAYLNGAPIEAAWCGIEPGSGDVASDLADLAALSDSAAFAAMKIQLAPGIYQSDTTGLDSSQWGFNIEGAGRENTALAKTVDNGEPLIRLGVSHASDRTRGHTVRDLIMEYTGAGEATSGCFLEMYNTRAATISDVSVKAAECGLLGDAIQHSFISGWHTTLGSRTTRPEAGIKITTSQSGLNAAGNYMSDIELSFGASGTTAPTAGLLVKESDGLYITNIHCQGPQYCFWFDPEAGTTLDYVLSVLMSNVYGDYSGVNNYRITGQADQAFGYFGLSNFEFRAAGATSTNLNPSATFSNWLASNGFIRQAETTGLYVGQNMDGVYLSNIIFADNNQADDDNGDINLLGDHFTLIGSRFTDNHVNGYGIRVHSAARAAKVIAADMRESLAGQKIEFESGSLPRELEIHASNEHDQVRRWDRDFYGTVTNASVAFNAFKYPVLADGEIVTLTAVANCDSDDGTGNVNAYTSVATFKNLSGVVTKVAETTLATHEEDAPTGAGIAWIVGGTDWNASGGGDEAILRLRSPGSLGVSDTARCSGDVTAKSSVH